MSRNNQIINHNQTSSASPRIRKATFADATEILDEDMTSSNTTNPYNSKQTNNNKNNTTTPKQKKRKQHNNNNTNNNNNNKVNDRSKVTSYFVSGPARSNERVKNSRAAQLKNNKGRQARKGSSTEITFNHKYRYDVNITLHSTTIETRLIELQTNIDELLSILIEEDKSVKLLPWKKSNQQRHPAITAAEDTNGSFADIYLSRSWLGNLDTKHRLYMKMYIGHDKSYMDLLPALDDWNSHSDRQFKYCMIQAEETTFIGWFLYSTLNIDAGALADAIYDEYNIEIGLRWMDVRMNNQTAKKATKSKPVKALHVETEKSKGRSIMEKLMTCYGRSFESTKNFPNGIRLRFCKNIDNAAYKLEKTKLINLRSRQKQLTAETNKTSTDGILDLDVIIKEETIINEDNNVTTRINTTLRDAIMAIQSKYVKNTPLFRSVDLAYNSEEYNFAFHQSMADEAKAMVAYLYPYLLHLYDSTALKKAFDAVHIQEMKSFKYNIITDEVEDIIAESTYAIMKEDKLTGTQNFMEFDLSAMSIEDDNERPQASILGKMYSGQDSISTQHHMGPTRTPQRTSEDVLEVTPDELQELQQAMILHTQTKHKFSERKKTVHIANLDTNAMIQQIRNRKTKGNINNQDSSSDDSSQSSDENQDPDSNPLDDDNYHDTEEQWKDNNEEDMNDESSNDEYDISEPIPPNLEQQHQQQQAQDQPQISQSMDVGSEPPTPPREGGKGW
jgi:hypothetical protein